MKLRIGLEEFIGSVEEAVERGEPRIVVFEAPTGYGKTRVGPTLYSRLSSGAGLPRLIHSLPLRAIVEEAYKTYRDSLRSTPVGYQAHGLSLAGKSPFFMPRVVVTTMDSFALNLFKSSVSEKGLGHYEVVRAHILSSLVVFDEAHLPFRDKVGPATALIAMLYTLARLGVSVAVETATLPRAVLNEIPNYVPAAVGGKPPVEAVTVNPPGITCRGRELRRVTKIKVKNVVDEDYYGWADELKWTFKPLKNLADAVEKAVALARSGFRVFLATTTVKNAIKAYNELNVKLGEGKVSIIHGRLTAADRRKNLKLAEAASVIVGTSAVEAGVNLDVSVVLTDVPTIRDEGKQYIAWDSLFQRIGRACRDPSRCREAEIPVYLYGERSHEATRTLQDLKVNPRIPCTYVNLLDEGFRLRLDPLILKNLEEIALKHVPHSRIKNVLRFLCENPYRGDMLISVIVPYEDKPVNLDTIGESLESDRYLVASLSQLRENARSWLAEGGEGYLALSVDIDEYRDHPSDVSMKLVTVKLEELRCERILSKGILAFIAKPGAYREGVGLR